MSADRVIKRATYAEGGETTITAHADDTHTVRDIDGSGLVVIEWDGLSYEAAMRGFDRILVDLELSGVKPTTIQTETGE
jgi:hypothetical protein